MELPVRVKRIAPYNGAADMNTRLLNPRRSAIVDFSEGGKNYVGLVRNSLLEQKRKLEAVL